MRANDRGNAEQMPLYEEIAARIGGQIEQGAYRPGDRIPSIRELSRKIQVSINTVMGAYAQLENLGMVVEARPIAVKAYDDKGIVLYCSSFSKTLTPGYRFGWILPGRYQRKVQQLKSLFNIATATPTQLAIAEFLANGGYGHHLRTIRRVYSRQVAKIRGTVGRHFPAGTSVTRPEGGFILWVELPEAIDAFKLYLGTLPTPDPEAERIFAALVARNGINVHQAAEAGSIWHRRRSPAAATSPRRPQRCLTSRSCHVGCTPWAATWGGAYKCGNTGHGDR